MRVGDRDHRESDGPGGGRRGRADGDRPPRPGSGCDSSRPRLCRGTAGQQDRIGVTDRDATGDLVTVQYVGVDYATGEEFDASWNRGQAFDFKLGKGQVIPGWDAGVQGMRVGGRRKLTIPSAMAYGARGAGGVIAPHAPLVFVVDLLKVD